MGSAACLGFWAEAAYSGRAEGCWLRASPSLFVQGGMEWVLIPPSSPPSVVAHFAGGGKMSINDPFLPLPRLSFAL